MTLTVDQAVIATSAAWALVATALVAIEKRAVRRQDNEWADHASDLRAKADDERNHALRAEAKHLAAERGLREYVRAVELLAGPPPPAPALSPRAAARAGQKAPEWGAGGL